MPWAHPRVTATYNSMDSSNTADRVDNGEPYFESSRALQNIPHTLPLLMRTESVPIDRWVPKQRHGSSGMRAYIRMSALSVIFSR